MISEGSCDTEDWSNDAENSALYHRNIVHFKMKSTRNIDQMNAVSIRDFIQKH